MEYQFKQIKLSNAERLWLTEILKLNFSKVDVKSLKVNLWKKLPRDFGLNTVDNRLIRDNRLTLVGLWHVDPTNRMFLHVVKTIETARDLILKNPGISGIQASEIARLVGMTEREAEIALMLIYDLGGFFGSATGTDRGTGFRQVSFRNNDSAYDQFLKFEELEQQMEEFFVRGASSRNIKNRKRSKSESMPNSGYFGKRPASADTWDDICKELEDNKLTFAKKINFVADKYKRKIIFRDVEDAYILAKTGFSKPAAILAGSIIEELLRLYLEHMNISPVCENFDGYIKTCEEKKLLKSGISRLSDSVRHFRNLVHLSAEKSKRYTISRAAGQSAVGSIFIIANDFQIHSE